MSNTHPSKKATQDEPCLFVKGKRCLLLIRLPQCYSGKSIIDHREKKKNTYIYVKWKTSLPSRRKSYIMNMRYSLLIFSHHRHRYNYPVLSSFMAHHRDCYTSNTTDDHPSGAPEFAPGFQQGSCYSIFSFMCNVLQIVVCPFVRFCLAIVVCPSQIYGF